MKFRIVKLEKMSGARCTLYSVLLDDDSLTLFEHFILENRESFSEELKEISLQLQTIAHKTGAKEQFFDKPEGNWGQDIWALYDKRKKNLRAYFFRLGSVAIVLGGGGHKSKSIRKLQDDPKLKQENDIIRMVSDSLTNRMKDKEIRWSPDGMELLGDLLFEDDHPDTDD